jgi:hypothetical protein
MKAIIEPFRLKTVEAIRLPPSQERERIVTLSQFQMQGVRRSGGYKLGYGLM